MGTHTHTYSQLQNMSEDEALEHVKQAAVKACQVIKWKP